MKNGKPANQAADTRPTAGRAPQALLLDMDGVLYHGNQVLPGAVAFVSRLAGLPVAYITNNPIRLPAAIADRLQSMGFPRPELEQIITSGEATALWLAKQKPGFRFYAIGADGLHQALSAYGQSDPMQADYVVVGEGPGLDYESLSIGIELILKRGAILVSTNPDATVDATVEATGQDNNGQLVHQVLPGGGALVAPLVIATGKQPVTIGKPEPLLYEMAMQRLGMHAADCLMIGDRPDTDILGAARLGMQTALVRTGRFAPGEPLPINAHTGADLAPDWDCDNLETLYQELQSAFPGWPRDVLDALDTGGPS